MTGYGNALSSIHHNFKQVNVNHKNHLLYSHMTAMAVDIQANTNHIELTTVEASYSPTSQYEPM